MQLLCKHIYAGHTGPVYVVLPKDDRHFFSAGSDGIIAQWEYERPEQATAIAMLNTPVYSLYYSPTNNKMWVGTSTGNIHLLDVSNKTELKQIALNANGIFRIEFILGKYWVLGGNGKLYVFDEDEKLIWELDLSESKLRSIVLFDGKLCIGDSGGQIFKINPLSFKVEDRFVAHNPSVYDLLVMEGYLYTCGRDGHIRKWNNENMLIWEIAAHNYAIYTLQEMEGKIVSSSRDRKIKIWDIDGGFIGKTYPEFGVRGSINSSKVWNGGVLAASDDKMLRFFHQKRV